MYRPRASDTFVGLIFSRLKKLQKIALMVSNTKSRACLLGSVAFFYKKHFELYFENDCCAHRYPAEILHTYDKHITQYEFKCVPLEIGCEIPPAN